jgi:hypothetical protein
VLLVENQLHVKAHEFSEQHLANVVWGAAKLRLGRLTLFQRVEVRIFRDLLASNDCIIVRAFKLYVRCGIGTENSQKISNYSPCEACKACAYLCILACGGSTILNLLRAGSSFA